MKEAATDLPSTWNGQDEVGIGSDKAALTTAAVEAKGQQALRLCKNRAQFTPVRLSASK